MVPKENFLIYSMQFVFLTIRLVPGNMVAQSCRSDFMELCENMYFDISVLFIVANTFILK